MRNEQIPMDIANVKGRKTALAAGTLLMLTLSLGGCATSTADSSLVDARAEAPAPKTTGYPSLKVLPPPSEIMTADKRSNLEKELTAARDRAVKAKRDASETVRSTNQADRQ
jgi:hypothetical protein